MNEHELPFNDDAHSEDEPEYEWLDEWLCEYVDGTMDPALEQVFEEYVEANPELKSHVENLRETRKLLCECSALKRASKKAKARVCGKVECEMLRSQASLSETFSDSTAATVGIASSLVVALVVGFFAGAVFFSPDGANVSLSPSTPAATSAEHPGPRSTPVTLSNGLSNGATISPNTTPASRADRAVNAFSLQPLVQRAYATSPADSQTTVFPPQSTYSTTGRP